MEPAILRDVARLKSGEFDLIVIGAGIHGACAARDAALRGLKVALVERGDLGGETSHNSLKTLHGGIRYIQHLDFRRTLESIGERIAWLRTAPHLATPLPFLMPTYGHGMRGPLAMLAGISLYQLLGFLGRARLLPGRVMGAKACLAMAPDLIAGMEAGAPTGAALWQDGQIRHADQAVIEIVGHAAANGAVVANYLEAIGLDIVEGRCRGVRVFDAFDGSEFAIRGRMVLNAAGPWMRDLLPSGAGKEAGASSEMALTHSMNIVTRRPPEDFALAIKSRRASDSRVGRTNRLYFMVPWQESTIFGTTHVAHGEAGPEDVSGLTGQINAFIDELNAACPALNLTLADVTYCYQGLTPAEDDAGIPDQTGPDQTGPDQAGPDQAGRNQTSADEASPGQTGTSQLDRTDPQDKLSLKDWKARKAGKTAKAKKTVKARKAGKVSKTGKAEKGGAARAHHSRLIDHEAVDAIPGLISIVGVKWTTSRLVAARAVNLVCRKLRIRARSRTATTPIPEIPNMAYTIAGRRPGDIDWIVYQHITHTMTVTLRDMLLRRTDDLVQGKLGLAEIRAVGMSMCRHLDWNAERQAAEIEMIRACWLPDHVRDWLTTDAVFGPITEPEIETGTEGRHD